MNILPESDNERGEILLATCLLDYFPNACAAVARHSAKSNEKHNPGQPPHWARDKSTDHRNKIARHLIDAGGFDKDGNRHSVALAWRGLALLEDELITEGATPGRNAMGSPTDTAHQLYDETSAIASAQDAKLDPTQVYGTCVLTPEQCEALGIGDVANVLQPATTIATAQHPANAETIRYHDERLHGPEGLL